MLNDLQALFTRTAFGDQVQFFHRATALDQSLMPAQPLMEDVESVGGCGRGACVHLGCPCRVCASKWRVQDWLQRICLV